MMWKAGRAAVLTLMVLALAPIASPAQAADGPIAPAPATTAEQATAGDASFVQLSDVHFNPFDPKIRAQDLAGKPLAEWPSILAANANGRLSGWGEDTNYPLFESAIHEISATAGSADFVLVTGDLLAHEFPSKVQQALGFPPGSAESQAFAAKTTLFVIERLQAALPGKPIFLALGNTDSGCGDYQIDPGGPYLEATREAVRALAGADQLASDFDEGYRAGGYYAAAHPTLANTTILVLDDALWSTQYRDSCGKTGLAGAQATMDWLERQLASAAAAGRKVWLMHHIPAGFDGYGTLNSKAATCRERLVPMLAEPFASRFQSLLARYASTITASFSGHDHHDDYRLLRDPAGAVIGMEKIAPAISPIFGQNPGFHLFSYDRATGAIGDFRTRFLANLATATSPATAEWQDEYVFSAAYGVASFTPATVEAMWKGLAPGGTTGSTFDRLYNVGHGKLSPAEQKAYACAIGYADPASFAACYCDP